MTPRDRERRRETERESVCEYTNEEDFQFNFIQKSRHRERERFFGLVQILSRKVSRKHPSRPRAPPANAASSPNVCFRTRPRRLHRHPRPSRSARRVQKRTHQFFPSGFPPLIIKVPLPFWWDPLTLSRKKTTRKNPCASSLPRARTSSPFLARENRRRRN